MRCCGKQAVRTTIAGGPMQPVRISYSDGTVSISGIRGGKDVVVFRVAGETLQQVDFGTFFRDYYSGVRNELGALQTSYPGQCVIPDTAVVHKEGGKEYLLFATQGLGDVYEIQASDGVSIEVNQASFGTTNPYSKGTNAPYYGDVISFTTNATGAPAAVDVDFGNPEAGAAANTATAYTGNAISHRYSGLTTSNAIKTTKKVKITASIDSTKSAEASVLMSEPFARIGVKSSALLFTQPNASATTPLLYGQSFVDASDGSVESHFASWTLDGVETKRLPNELQPVGACTDQAHTLSLKAQYGYYDSATFTQRNTPDFSSSVTNLAYTVRPFVASIAIESSDATGVTYKPSVLVGAAITGGTAASATFKWELLDGAGAPVGVPSETTASLGTGPSFKVATANLLEGYTVRLTVSIAPTLITEASCQGTGMESLVQSVVLKVPDPAIAIASGQCTNVGSPCDVTSSSISGQDRTAWKYSWYLAPVKTTDTNDSAFVLKRSGLGPDYATYTPSLSATGDYSVKLRVQNDAGIILDTAPKWFTLDAPLCSGKPTAENISISYSGATSGCTTNCTSADTLRFSIYWWGYELQSCDQLVWDFGDGTPTSTLGSPTHKYAANGTYTVKLTVTNNAPGTNPAPVTLKVTLGVQPPSCAAPSNMIGFRYSGPTSGCTISPGAPSCVTGESIAFTALNYPSSTFQSCDRFRWNFGDGSTSSSQNPTKKFSAPGTYVVGLTVSNTAGSETVNFNVKVAQGADNSCPVPSDRAFVAYQGLSSGCTANSGTPCNPGETLRLTASTWSGSFNACDRFDWNFGDGSAPVTNQTSKTIDHVFAGAQLEYPIILTVKNTSGSVTVSDTKVKFAGEPIEKPTTVDFTWSGTTAVIGTPVRFTATATAPADHPVTSWQWSFGDGVNKTGNPVEHTFSTEGTWNVTLTASNAGGSAPPVTKSIKVLEANAFTYLLPVVSHLNGANGSQWRTDLQIYNSNVGEGPVELEFELTNQGLKKTFALNTSTLIYEDFMSFFTDADTAGPVIVRGAATHDLQIWTRTYSVGASGIGTYGHLIPAIRIDGDQSFTSGETALFMTGVTATPKYRTNIYLLNLTTEAMPVTITAYEGQFGAAVGQVAQQVAPFQLTSISASQITGAPADKPFSIAIKGNSDGLIAYESVVDNGSNDPIYVPAMATGDLGDVAMKNQVVPSIGHAGPWRSDVTVFNPDDQAIQFDLAFYDQTGTLKAEAKDKILPAKGLLQLDDILRSDAISIPEDVIGTLRLSVDSPLADQFPIVAQRNYSDAGDQKRFGQGILGFGAAAANVKAGKPAIIPAVRNDQLYKSNVGLVNVGAGEASIQLTLLDQSTGQPVGSFPITLQPNESRILPEAIPNVFLSATDRGSIKVEVTNDGSVWAFAAIIDRATSDPEYVPAIPLD